MGLRIATNVPSLSSQRTLAKNNLALNNSFRKLSSGSRITRSSDDAAGLAISENLKAQIRSVRQNKRNANDAIGLIQTAEGALNEVSTMIIRLRELSIQAASDTVGDRERSFSDIEFQNLKDEIQRISLSTEFNGIRLLDGSNPPLEFQVGMNNDPFMDRITYDSALMDSSLERLGVGELSISSKVGAQTSLQSLDEALVQVNGYRANLGAKQNRLSSVIRNLEMADENFSAANSRIRDVDLASETANLARNSILVQSGVSVLSQANQSPNMALKLLNA